MDASVVFDNLVEKCDQIDHKLPTTEGQGRVLGERISQVYSSGLEESVQKFLESLGKLKRAYLTDLEEKVLRVLETEMKD
ncbi:MULTISPECIES: hypothetical protein [unclassified Tolypothrix]|uniref:hypothetical protein n=1 Tax=unclassified Tolypothrix TaxID=2649714 RepID=UPI0005EAA7ED|nr:MULTISPECIES: hypothetical protein [unclassified Tolypothrix]BAY93728.1 hypothetical protein NIES3275_57700 [Microchaete diplosiphon NIES-3275]EKF03268.1 hypothetical protein FDUTEX481_02726 [Tolypothrix sp. PCC 7601]MBE9082543.1 hypothetical protein [Tolypothrix sp. LEGE 11397]UYD27535.1 hypothetical protein HGR01_05495 [Tolypothrix sp. PCC 7712]UYD36603.1 hypothetical protein HG267_13215 [Tolypothrix sp. PCC 7601]